MKSSVHRFILPPVLLGVHLLLLLPLFLAPHIENPGQEPERESQDDGQEPLLQRLHLKYSIPLGVLGFAGVHVLKQLAGEVPLPKDPRRIQLAARIEKSVLFGLGVVEEIWRWGVVRVLIRLEGGKGGFRGRGELWDLLYASLMGTVATADEFGVVSPTNTKYPTIWEAVYLMGWIWSLVETVFSWYSIRPTSAGEIRRYQETHGFRRGSGGNSLRRPLLGRRTRCSDYSTIQTSDDNTGVSSRAGERRSFFECINRKRRDLGSPQSGSSRAGGRRGVRRSGGGGGGGGRDLTIQFATSPHVEGSSSTTACDGSLQASSATPKAFGKAMDMEQGEATPRACQDTRVQPLERQDGISDNDYGDDEGSLSGFGSDSGLSSQSSCSGERVPPILSSSLSYDPEPHHPHHEHILHRQTSYSTLGDAAAAVLSSSMAGGSDYEGDEGEEIVEIHEDDYQGVEPQQSEPNPIAEAIPITPSASRSPQRRIYPSFPSYSASYNHAHFPQSSGGAAAGSSSNTATTTTTAVAPRYCHSHPRRRVYGVSVDRLHAYLPIMWRTAAMLRHIGHAMFFAWAPTLIFQGRFQWWCFLVLVMLAVRKGWNTVEWFGGSASRAGLLKSSTLLLGISTAIYLVSLDLWGLLW